MQNKDLQNNNTKYNFSNKESQRLFQEFTVLLADITKYIDAKEKTLLTINSENEDLKQELKKVKDEIKISQEELKNIKNEYNILSNKLAEASGGKYMVKALLRKVKNKINISSK